MIPNPFSVLTLILLFVWAVFWACFALVAWLFGFLVDNTFFLCFIAWRWRPFRVLAIGLLAACVGSAARAADAAGAPTSNVYYGQLLNIVLQIIGAVISSVLGVLGVVLINRLNAKYKLGLTEQEMDIIQRNWSTIHSTASAAAARWWALNEGAKVAELSVTVYSPKIAQFAQEAINQIPQEAAQLGQTPQVIQDEMEKLIVAKIGAMQHSAPASRQGSRMTLHIDPASVRLGKRAPIIDLRVPRMLAVLDANAPVAPISVDWTGGQTSFGMMLNDTLGCCTIAGLGHQEQIWTKNAYGKEWSPSDGDIDELYCDACGYKNGVPSTDNGGVEADVLAYVMKHGMWSRKIVGYASVDFKKTDEVRQAIFLAGGLYLGLALPIAAQKQAIWDVPIAAILNSENDPGSWGLHCAIAVGYDAKYVYVLTWGKIQKVTWAWLLKYADEAWAILGAAWIRHGKAPNGFNLPAMQTWMARIAA